MTRYTPTELQRALGSGLLSFPVTHFTDELQFDEAAYRDNLAWLSSHPAAGLFAAGGTGEFFSLTSEEVGRVVRAAVEASGGAMPILGPAGYGTAQAVEMARDAERAGADGILLFPPYLTEASQDGLAAHVQAVCAATSLGVIVYHRANGAFRVPTVEKLVRECPNLIGFKDGVGDIELMTLLYATVGDRLLYIGGLPTAETFALPYLELGVTTYSSAIFNFAPSSPWTSTPPCGRRTVPASTPGSTSSYCPTWRSGTATPAMRCRSSRPACGPSAARRARSGRP